MVYKIPSTMVQGYCTHFLINNGQWSGGGLPINLSPSKTDQGSMMSDCCICNSFLFVTL